MKRAIYIFSDGELRRKDNTLYFESESGRRYVPIENTSELHCFGNITFNKRMLEFLTQHGIVLHYYNYYGYYSGTFYPREHLNSGYMILKQAEVYLDSKKRLALARLIAHGAARNMLQVLKYYANRGRKLYKISAQVEDFAEKLNHCASVDELMGIEGNMRQRYYQGFDVILSNTGFVFGQRSKRPPKNRLNALISFGNSLLYTTVLSEIYKTHLDPRIGFLHATNFRRFSLNLDVAEVFKPIIVDRLIFSLVGKKNITPKDFIEESNGLFLKEEARQLFVQEFEKRLNTTIKHRKLKRNVSYRRLLRLEVYKIGKHLMGDQEYQPFVARW